MVTTWPRIRETRLREKKKQQTTGALDTCRETEREERDLLYSSSLLWLLPYSCLVLKLGEEHQR